MNFLSPLLNNKRLIRNGLKKSNFALGSLVKDLKGITDKSQGTIHLSLRLCRKPPRVSGNRTCGPSLMEQWPRRKKDAEGLTGDEAAPVRWSRFREGLEDHGDVRVAVGDGRSRPVTVRRRRCSSAARNLAYSQRDSSIKRVRELHWVLGKTWVQGI
jgi:hypothetical protein